MGQKIHPHGLRLGVNRKWNTTWFAEEKKYKNSFYAQLQLEYFLKSFLYFYSYVKNSATKKATLVELKWFRAGITQIYLFVFFYKYRTKKRRWTILKKNRNKKYTILKDIDFKNKSKNKKNLQKKNIKKNKN